MRANEIMIGDYLKTFTQKIVKVKEIKQNCIYTEDNGYDYNEIEPITLTPEILEKNGFESRKDGYDIGIPLLYWDKYCNAICGWSHCDDIIEIFDCRYVHQLQHALRLCGIDKTIEL